MKKFLPFFFEEFKSRFAFMVVEIATLKMFEKNLLIFCSFMKIVQEKRLRERLMRRFEQSEKKVVVSKRFIKKLKKASQKKKHDEENNLNYHF